jgi:hypothetical protein
MRTWIRHHRIAAALLWTVLAVAATEGLLLYYYLNSWFIMPLL